ncbi:MAG: YfiR family protein [Bacteroidia bacterium]|nr:YfiR family protein [Bacteroidia bacterium]
MANFYPKAIFNNRLRGILLLLFFSLPLVGFKPAAQENEVDYKIHAKFIYHFTKYIHWPTSAAKDVVSIGILGNDVVYSELQTITPGKKVGTLGFKIDKLTPESNFGAYNLIFVSATQMKQFDKVITATGGKPILIITEKTGYARKGGDINFYIDNDRLRFEINEKTITSKGMNIATDLLVLGTIVK